MANISVQDLTTNEPEGSGVFDNLMASAKEHIIDEYNNSRINQSDYAKIYLGTLQATLGQAVQFLLSKQISDKQADLISAQIANTEQDTLTKVEQTKLTATQNQLAKQQVINATIEGKVLIGQSEKMEQEVLLSQQQVLNMEQQVLKTIAEVSMLGKQEEKIDADIVLAQQQLQSMASEIALINARRNLVEAQVLAETKSLDKIDAEINLITAQGSKITQEIALMVQRQANLAAEKLKIDAETALLQQRLLSEVQQTALIAKQVDKINAEVNLLVEKRWTERAQWSDSVDGSNTDNVAGVIGKQKELFTAQRDGFKRDAEQKLAKIATDTWSVRKNADVATTIGGTGLDNTSIGKIIEKCATEIGVTITP